MRADHVKKIANALPVWLQEFLIDKPAASVAGGFCRALIAGETPKDIDVWTPARIVAYSAAARLVQGRDGELKLSPSRSAVNILWGGPPVSFVSCRRPESLEECLRSFDFTVCRAGVRWDGETWVGLVSEDFYPDLAGRRLVVVESGLNSPAATLQRVCRYIGRGYRIDGRSRARLVKAIHAMGEDEIDELTY